MIAPSTLLTNLQSNIRDIIKAIQVEGGERMQVRIVIRSYFLLQVRIVIRSSQAKVTLIMQNA